MARVELDDYQLDAIRKMHNGCILNGGVGSGKSRTALAYYCQENGGSYTNQYRMGPSPRDLYIITTAKKRDSLEWEEELNVFLLSSNKDNITIDSWNNIQKYSKVCGAFFIFDEQRVVGSGAWVKAFLDITRKNKWILLSATPGDTWSDYLPVFMANGYFHRKSDFNREHVVFQPYCNFPKILRYVNTWKLEEMRNSILVDMDYKNDTERVFIDIFCSYKPIKYKTILRERFNEETNQPFKTIGEVCYALRKLVNSDSDRMLKFVDILHEHDRVIVFYNFDYELELLKQFCEDIHIDYAQWNGHKHEGIPRSDKWIYLVQYSAGAEGWNCIETDTIVFWSQNYSYKIFEQACGRIDRRNTPYNKLYYYILKSRAPIDVAITRSMLNKKKFNEKSYLKNFFERK